ncbi:response regulator [Thermostaphylospora chromogena]|uniref:DNA-binding response regulator, NarL/FixJ family, contains REC and HTH domains n=1 Tax=Thermostaphylospora chromogena TaxID=35622 RepID=A0A1H1DDP2_9ACTN|nr:response regulator transcription factor [Thermostaphylospora chromogena]SDQ74510.1 DNA-binding response regulator, NarL/FixJ family, contains REC and HTH domains [Thermostaphylospora chromogena]
MSPGDARNGGAAIRVVIADDHPIVRQGLRTFLELSEDITIVGEAADGAEAVDLVASLAPDVLLLDLRMPGMDGHAALRALAERGLDVRVLVLTSVSDRGDVAPAMRAGAAGFLYKDVDPSALVQAIRAVAGGQVLLAPEAARAVLDEPDGAVAQSAPTSLTERELQVLKLIAMGRSNREIARELSVAEKTVKTHVSNVFMKLGVQDRTQAALYAVRHGLA